MSVSDTIRMCLQDNIWSDPAERDFNVYLPPGYSESGEPYVALWDFAAFTNAGPGHLNWKNQGENLPQRLDRLIGSGEMPPVVVPMPDCYSSLGGNQYVNSPAVGRYADYVVDELVPFLSSHVNVIDHRDGRGVFGKSSGGYGALVHAMYYPETWGGLASHAGDIGFEWVYRPDFPRTAAVLSAFGGDPYRFLKNFWRNKHPGSPDYSTLMTLAMAASYDPGESPESPIQLPFDLHTCELDMTRWNQWLSHDPLNLLESYASNLLRLTCSILMLAAVTSTTSSMEPVPLSNALKNSVSDTILKSSTAPIPVWTGVWIFHCPNWQKPCTRPGADDLLINDLLIIGK